MFETYFFTHVQYVDNSLSILHVAAMFVLFCNIYVMTSERFMLVVSNFTNMHLCTTHTHIKNMNLMSNLYDETAIFVACVIFMSITPEIFVLKNANFTLVCIYILHMRINNGIISWILFIWQPCVMYICNIHVKSSWNIC